MKITKEDIERSIKYMIGKKFTVKEREKIKHFWKTGNLLINI
jgi:hypothetical protein